MTYIKSNSKGGTVNGKRFTWRAELRKAAGGQADRAVDSGTLLRWAAGQLLTR
jgi:hypothetical protein